MRTPKFELSWINQKRVEVYPRLFFIAIWAVMVVNLLLHSGWQGGFGQIIGGDFIVFFSTGLIYKEDPSLIYDYNQQFLVQQSLVKPIILRGVNPNINPPYVTPVYSILSTVPLPWAFLLWTLCMVICTGAAITILMNMVPPQIKNYGLTSRQFTILVFSFFPLIESLLAGQNSALTFLLMTCVIFSMYKNKHFLAGLFAGIMIYKPQYVVGFLILWVVWKNYKSLLGFLIVAVAWTGAFYLANGIELYQTFLNLSKQFLQLSYVEGFPGYILVTLYGFLTTILPQSFQPYIYGTSVLVLMLSTFTLAIIAHKSRDKSLIERTPVISLAILFPLVATPYSQLHDLVILIPGFVLWSLFFPSRGLLITVIGVYLGAFFLTFAGALSHIALNSLLVLGLTALVIYWIVNENKLKPLRQTGI